jgi:aldehyde dehydrogenase (NAD+)
LLVQESIAEKVIERLKRRMAKLRLGEPLDKSMDMGAIIAPIQKERIQNLVDRGKKDGGSRGDAVEPSPLEPPSFLPRSTRFWMRLFNHLAVGRDFAGRRLLFSTYSFH